MISIAFTYYASVFQDVMIDAVVSVEEVGVAAVVSVVDAQVMSVPTTVAEIGIQGK